MGLRLFWGIGFSVSVALGYLAWRWPEIRFNLSLPVSKYLALLRIFEALGLSLGVFSASILLLLIDQIEEEKISHE